MRWEIHGENVSLTPTLSAYIERKIRDKIAQLGTGIREVSIKIARLGSRRSDRMRQAKAVVVMNDGQVHTLHQGDSCFYAAIDGLSDRLSYAVRKSREKFRQLRRKNR